MKHMMWVFVFTVLCTGCKAHMVETQGEHIQLLGKRPDKGGVIRYLNTGMESWKQARRADAEKQMGAFCGGPYKITDEGPRSQFGSEMPIGKTVTLEVDQYTYLRFKCGT